MNVLLWRQVRVALFTGAGAAIADTALASVRAAVSAIEFWYWNAAFGLVILCIAAALIICVLRETETPIVVCGFASGVSIAALGGFLSGLALLFALMFVILGAIGVVLFGGDARATTSSPWLLESVYAFVSGVFLLLVGVQFSRAANMLLYLRHERRRKRRPPHGRRSESASPTPE